MINILKKLTGAFGVSGNEDEIRNTIKERLADCVDEIYTDPLGNLVAVKKGRGKKIMIAAHMDETGVIATHIDDKGFIRFTNIGFVSPYYALGQRIKFRNGITGSISYEEKLSDMKDLRLTNMYIDIGTKGSDETKKKISVGDAARFVGETVMEGDMVISRGLDNRSGCSVLIKTACELPDTDNEIYYVFTVQEELGCRGSKAVANRLKPDLALVVDVTGAGDTPECKLKDIKCGHGPAIKIKDKTFICHSEVREIIENAAKKLDIPYQYEILETGSTDSGAIFIACDGIPTGAISIPCRYIHTTIEMLNIKDVENASKLLMQCIV